MNAPKITQYFDDESSNNKISSTTRDDVFRVFEDRQTFWWGDKDEIAFLNSIFDLNKMPSTDSRFSDAAGDIWQHRINNYDWENDWIISDRRFNLLRCKDEIFLKFISRTVHPSIRQDADEVQNLVSAFNDYLRTDGYHLVRDRRISNRWSYVGQPLTQLPFAALEAAREEFGDDGYIQKQIGRMTAAVEDDPDLAIGTAKELIETICRNIAARRQKPIEGNPSLPKLVKETCSHLQLTRDDIDDGVAAAAEIKKVLSAFGTIVDGLNTLRNSYGSGHGRPSSQKGLSARHARLSVGAAATLAVFIHQTEIERAAETK